MEANSITQCPICKSEDQAVFLESADYSYTKESFNICVCKNCDFKFTNPIPTEATISDYYNTDNYISYSAEKKKGLFQHTYHFVRKITTKRKRALLTKYATGKDLLDIGCGTGEFLNFMKESGWNSTGLEINPEARETGKKNYGVDIKDPELIDQIADNSFDIITMWHVLEHIYHLDRDIIQFKRILKDDGSLIVAVPNCSSHDAKKYGKFWDPYDLPIHLYHYTPNDIRNLFEKFGMTVVKVIPMKFDSYYASMLSEKHKSGTGKMSIGMMIKGFFAGLSSNMKANNETYSSQTYVIQKKKS